MCVYGLESCLKTGKMVSENLFGISNHCIAVAFAFRISCIMIVADVKRLKASFLDRGAQVSSKYFSR